jgi:hypothetical protein
MIGETSNCNTMTSTMAFGRNTAANSNPSSALRPGRLLGVTPATNYTLNRTHNRSSSSTTSTGGGGVKQRAAFPQFCAICDKQLPSSGKVCKLYCSFECRDKDSLPSPSLSLGSSVFEDTSEMYSPTTSSRSSSVSSSVLRRYSEPPGSFGVFGDFLWAGPDDLVGTDRDNNHTDLRKNRSRSVYIRSGLPLYGEHAEEDILVSGGLYRMPVPAERPPSRLDLEYEFPRPR